MRQYSIRRCQKECSFSEFSVGFGEDAGEKERDDSEDFEAAECGEICLCGIKCGSVRLEGVGECFEDESKEESEDADAHIVEHIAESGALGELLLRVHFLREHREDWGESRGKRGEIEADDIDPGAPMVVNRENQQKNGFYTES